MLPTPLLSYRIHDGQLSPTWLTPRDEPWVRELAAEIAVCDGRRTDIAEDRIEEVVAPIARRHGASRRIIQGVWAIERRRWGTRVDSPVPPERIRRVVFDLAARRGTREAVLGAAGLDLGLEPDLLESLLFADRTRARLLVAPRGLSTASELIDAYNLGLAQSFLVRSTEIEAVVRANVRRVVSYAKLLALMTLFEECEDGALRMKVSGPLALFHETLKYGRALARWAPAVVTTPGWSLDARVVVGAETLRLHLDASSPLPRSHEMPRASDSKLEARLERDLRRLGSSWRMVREADIVRSGARLFFPDFTLASDRGRVLVEVVGFWTPDYLAEKAVLLRSVDVPIVMCVDRRYAKGDLLHDPRVLPFDGRIDAARLLELCERTVGGQRAPIVTSPRAEHRHYMMIPTSSAMQSYAVRAGARANTWREDVFDDLTSAGRIRALRRPETSYGAQLGLLGEQFYGEANVHARRPDTLFVHRVRARCEDLSDLPREHAISVELLSADREKDAEPRDPASWLFES